MWVCACVLQALAVWDNEKANAQFEKNVPAYMPRPLERDS